MTEPASLTAQNILSRRAFLHGSGLGLGALAVNSLLPGGLGAAEAPVPAPHRTPRARSVIFLHMVGAPSQLDLYDHKPGLQKYDRTPAPDSFIEGKRFAFLRGHPKLLASPYQFKRHGHSGLEFSELLPHIGSVADDLAVVKSLHTDEFNHGPAQLFFHTGLSRIGNPSIGSWVHYGLGSINQNLPGYVVFLSGAAAPGGGSSLWHNGFLPSVHQGVEFRSEGDPVLFLSNPKGIDDASRLRTVDTINRLNENHLRLTGDPEVATRMSQYELACRMQLSVPELMDLSEEPAAIRAMYGDGQFASHCLQARRLVERGVRFVELFNSDWDTHGNQDRRLRQLCGDVDQPVAALIRDLKQRGLLDQTLVVFGGEFGRTPMLEGDQHPDRCGRDHHRDAFTVLMAGGGVQGGISYGETDDLGYNIVRDPLSVHDFHATLLAALGLDHEQVTYRFRGLDQRLTGVEDARVARGLFG